MILWTEVCAICSEPIKEPKKYNSIAFPGEGKVHPSCLRAVQAQCQPIHDEISEECARG